MDPIRPSGPAPPARSRRSRQDNETAFGAELAHGLHRVAAKLIDGLVLSPIMLIVFARSGVTTTSGQIPVLPASTVWIVLLIQAVYEVVLVAVRGQTVGRMAVRIRVVRDHDGGVPGWLRSLARWATVVAAGLVPVVGPYLALLVYLWVFWDRRRQGIHDKVARTVVVRVPPTPRPAA
ncbi:MAG TPA: RDD family protein [Acidimicrobiales bacterium]|nr:RDD family protein [Acidimicrobiales bacterium]